MTSLIYKSPFPDVDIPHVTVTEYLFDRFKQLGERTALIDCYNANNRVSFNQVVSWSERLAYGLQKRGIKTGDVLATLSPNCMEYPIILFGAMHMGAVCSGMNPAYTVEEIAFQLRDSGAVLLFTNKALYENAKKAVAHVPAVKRIIVIDSHEYLDLLAEQGPLHQPHVNPATHLAVLPYSSGTTGVPKGVMLTHRNLVANLQQMTVDPRSNPDGAAAMVLPMFHIYGLTVVTMRYLYIGKTLVIFPKFDLEVFLRNIQQHRIERLPIVPPIVLLLAKHPLIAKYDLSSVKEVFSGAAPLPEDVAHECVKRLNVILRQGYGMTELSPVSHLSGDGAPLGGIGQLVPNMEAMIVDTATGIPQPSGKEGELLLRGPNVMKGYLNNPKATAETIDRDGWLHTGDVAIVDKNGYYFIVDRVKELIKVKGLQVAPAELENILLTHPKIADAAVVSYPEIEHGEIPKAFIVVKPNQHLSAEEVMEFVRPRVAHHKRIRLVEFIDAIPKTASGKILRKDLRARDKGKQQQAKL